MTRSFSGRFVTATAAFAMVAWGCSAATLSAQGQQDAGWRSLFDGKTQNGWRVYQGQSPSSGWSVVDGALMKTKATDDLISVDQFGDFELTLEWKVSRGGNAGLFYRGTEEYEKVYWSATEYQLLDDPNHRDGQNRLTSAGAAYGLYPAAAGVVKPAGEWNSTRIVAKGNKIEHWLNGEKVCEAEIGSEDWNARVAKSKWSKTATYAKEPKGKIDLQDHGDKVEYKNIKVLVLK